MTILLSLILFIFVCATVLQGFVLYAEEKVDGIYRTGAPGDFVGLSEGVTHYRLEGPEAGPVILCVHGLTTPSYVFDGMVPALVAKGYRVLRFDLYGRGYSDRPSGAYDADRYVDQAFDLLDALGIEGPVTAMGYSMGGCIVTAMAEEEPSRIKRLVLLAPGGLGHDLGRFMEWCAKVPVLGDLAFQIAGGWVLRSEADAGKPKDSTVPNITDRIKEETWTKGYMPAVLSSLREMLAVDQAAAHGAISAQDIPVMAVWGSEDTAIPIAAKARLEAANPNARHVVIEGAGHDIPYANTDAVLAALLG